MWVPRSVHRIVTGICVLISPLITGSLRAQDSPSHCFQLAMLEDGRPVEVPTSITFIDGSEREEVEAQDKEFCVPPTMLSAPSVDVTFEAAGNRFSLAHLKGEALELDWEISFGGKKYAKLAGLPKNTPLAESCSLVLRRGSAERQFTIPQCRIPVNHSH